MKEKTQEERIQALQEEAGRAGDMLQVDLCQRALAGDQEALEECLEVLQAPCGDCEEKVCKPHLE